MPRRDELSEQDVLNHLARFSQPVSFRELARALEVRGKQHSALARLLKRLKQKEKIEEDSRGRFRLHGARAAAPETSALRRSAGTERRREAGSIGGRLVAHRDGYGFVVPDEPIAGVEGDLFIGRDAVGDAMHGDRVVARITRRRPDGRAEGRIVEVSRRAHPTVVGVFRYGPRGNFVEPLEARIPQQIVIPPGDELTPALREKLGPGAGQRARLPELDGAVVNVELSRYPRAGVAAAGRVVEILGQRDDFGVDVEIVIRKHHLPREFPDEVLGAARGAPQEVRQPELAGREDFRALPIVTIDGETAKDFDDAVYVEALPGGRWRLDVHIADVAHYVARGSALDREARLRGTSVYFPDRALPMLPEEFSNGICSLKPRVDRLVMSVVMEIDAHGQVTDARFARGVIRSAERMTYTNVNRVLEGDAEMTARYAALAPHFQRMRDLALVLNARRVRRGSIDFDLPEPVIEFDELGRMVKIVRSERNIANRIIEEFMLAANETVARYLESRGIASLHRVHEKPDAKKVLEFEELARAFGYSLGVEDLAAREVRVRHGRRAQAGGRERAMKVQMADEEVNIRPQHYQRLTQKIAGKPEERILSYLMLRSLKQARYSADALGHFALAFDSYTHFTSPIRRYPDLIVHRILKWALDHPGKAVHASRPVPVGARAGKPGKSQPEAESGIGPYRRVELEEISVESSEAERRADGAERELMDWKTARFMEQHLGEEYDALVISVLKFGFFVELVEIFVEGLVTLESLETAVGERCFYREADHAIVSARGRRVFRLGDRVRVRAERIDWMRHRVEFALTV
jgi:ribonuclease R